jgi:copper(I)-binding protein
MAIVAACSSTGGGTATAGTLTVTGAWARPSMTMALAGAAYLTITNGTGQADALLGVTTPAAKNPELHETTAGASGMMAMRPVARIEIPAGKTVKLEPGGYHIMLINLTAELVVGSTIELTLQFEKAAPVTVIAEVRAS